MELSSDAEKHLNESLLKCRCCFRMLIDDRKAVTITEEVRKQFEDLTNIELLISEIFADRICQLCASDLKVFANLREDLISKQKALYEMAGLELAQSSPNSQVKEVNDDTEMTPEDETSQEFDWQFEAIEETPMFEDEEMASEFISEADEQESSEAAAAVIKIEKVQENEETAIQNVFDFFEEIVGDSDGEREEKYEAVETEAESESQEMIFCDTCGIELSKSHLTEHCQIMHQPFVCQHCDKKFQSKISLKRHSIETHFSEKVTRSKKRFFCPLCPKDYDYRKQLDDHIRSFHEKERNSQCHICYKTFYHRDLKKHIEHVHGDKNVACEMCGKLYTCVENLRLHMRYHQPPSFSCTFPGCGKKFHQKVLWEHHEKKHSADKPVTCDHCGSAFYSVRDMRRHQQRVHEKVTRKCQLCEVSFSRKDKYRQHLLKKHRELMDDERDAILDQIRTMKWHES